MPKKPKPATAGEKMVLARVRETLGPKTMTLSEFRTRGALCHCRAEAKAHDRAIARAVRKERERCTKHALDSYIMQEDGWQAWQDIEKGTPV